MTEMRLMNHCSALGVAVACCLASSATARGETGYDAWLRYAPLEGAYADEARAALPAVIVPMGDSPIIQSATDELIRGIRGMTGRVLRVERELPDEPAIVVGTVVATGFVPGPDRNDPRTADGYHVFFRERDGVEHLFVVGTNPRSALYAAFALLRTMATNQPLAGLDDRTFAAAPIRIVNHWDNLDGTIERGYAGRSIFWDKGHVREELSRVRDYGRLLASVGINGCSINNVNADVRVITPEYLPEVARIAEALRPWGVRVFLSLNFAAPREVGGIDTFDPLDPQAVAFWKETVDRVYEAVPDLGGFVLKADSEGRLGPSEYKRTHADAANVIAEAARPRGGTLFYRGFVYNHRMDWRDLKNDRATAAYNNFHPLDGKFLDNVVVQIKHGPIDFQVREPASPLFSGIPQTNKAIELQITQEYLGQQKHLCYIVPMWKEVLDFDMHAGPVDAPSMPVKALIGAGGVGGAGRGRGRPGSQGGFVGVSNVGLDENWLGHHLAMVNLYGFGRLAWNPELSSEEIAEEWTRQTFGNDLDVVRTIVAMMEASWEIYEQYTGNLGIGTLTDIIHVHFGPAPESSEYNGWGQWHRANETGVGMDRTIASGTGFTKQYAPAAAALFESIATCPDELLLFFHHVPYTHVLRNGKTVIQHMYDEHYDGADRATELVDAWASLAGRIDDQRFGEVLARLEYQAGHAVVWRDAISNWFHKKSGIADERGRVGVHPGRFEAEELNLNGYEPTDVTPWEAASGSRAAQLPEGVDQGSATHDFAGEPGWYDLHVQYFDEEDGESRFRVLVNDQEVDAWQATDHVPTPSKVPDAHTSSRRTIGRVALRPGDAIRVEGTASGGERAGLDYVEIVAAVHP